MKKIDFLAIGDMTIDAFIKLNDAHVHKNIDKPESNELCFRFGDKIPFDSVTIVSAVGNSSNAAVTASRLGLNSALITNIGNDRDGKDCLEVLKKEKVKTKFVNIEKNKKTNYHYVLWYGTDRTILVKHTEFEYKFPKLPKVSWIYLSSLAENSLEHHKLIVDFLEKHPETKLAFQPGTFQMKFGAEKLKDIYARTEIFFCNLEEAERILGVQNKNVLELSQGIHALGPKIVSISDGTNGAYMYLNNELWQIPIYPDKTPALERTGAGDAFSSSITAGLVIGLSPLDAFAWGPINAMSVVQKIGSQAGLLSRKKLEAYLNTAPENFKIKKIS